MNASDDRDPNALDDVRLADIRDATMLRNSGSMSFDVSVESAPAGTASEIRGGQ